MLIDNGRINGAPRIFDDASPGRVCPLHYRYAPEVFRVAPLAPLQSLDVLYVVGGLYGNELALQRVLELFDHERGRKRVVFNGDFHWFDNDPDVFARVQTGVLAHHALRGNVETELASDAGDDEFGCGCAYPEWVDQSIVERSNRILRHLRDASTAPQRAELGSLPMWLRADVGPLRIGVVHGDATSLAGWGFAQEHLQDDTHREQVAHWFDQARVDAFACTHTCLPIFQAVRGMRRSEPRWVLNNGATGMPNFRGDRSGLLTRVALAPFEGDGRRFGIDAAAGHVHIEAISVDFDHDAWLERFCLQWPPGSDAYLSYFDRMTQGPAYEQCNALRTGP